jgi:hypothetical protein
VIEPEGDFDLDREHRNERRGHARGTVKDSRREHHAAHELAFRRRGDFPPGDALAEQRDGRVLYGVRFGDGDWPQIGIQFLDQITARSRADSSIFPGWRYATARLNTCA